MDRHRYEIKKRKRQQQQLPIIPDELIEDILSRLPCKSLARWRCVSKQWNSLLLPDQNFIQRITRNRVLICTNPLRFINLDDDHHNDDDFVVEVSGRMIRTPPPPHHDSTSTMTFTDVVGECNGLFCLADMCVNLSATRQSATRRFLLWNPTTGECQHVFSDIDVPVSFTDPFITPITRYHIKPTSFQMFGFGYDSIINDYKILCLERTDPYSITTTLSIQIYTIGSQTCKKMELSGSYMTWKSPGFHNNRSSFLMGACHWLITKFPCGSNAILSFDCKTEQVREVVALPPCLSSSRSQLELRVFDGKLLLTNQISNNELDIWLMNEQYDAVGSSSVPSFTKKVTLCEIPKSRFNRSFVPVCFLREGNRVLVFDGERLIGFDSDKGTYSVVEARGCRQDVSVYTETLMSPLHIIMKNKIQQIQV